MFSSHPLCAFMIVFLHFYILIVSRMRKERACQDIRMRQLSANKYHTNNGFGAQNVRAMMGMSGVQYSGPYGSNWFITISTHAAPVDKKMAVVLSFSHTALCYSSEQHNDRKNNGRKRKSSVMMHWVFERFFYSLYCVM